MEKSFEKVWSDFLNRYRNFRCPFCNKPELGFDGPKFDTIAGVKVVVVSCKECGHVEFFDIEEVKRVAKEVDQDFREKGWR